MVNLSKLSERLNDLMDDAELNLPELKRCTNLDESVISRILNKERIPSYKTLITLADFFICTTDYLLGLSDNLDEKKFKQCPPFNEQLDFLLNYFKISKYRIEKETGLSEETVNRWHKGKNEPSVESIIKLAKCFDCSVDFVLGRES